MAVEIANVKLYRFVLEYDMLIYHQYIQFISFNAPSIYGGLTAAVLLCVIYFTHFVVVMARSGFR